MYILILYLSCIMKCLVMILPYFMLVVYLFKGYVWLIHPGCTKILECQIKKMHDSSKRNKKIIKLDDSSEFYFFQTQLNGPFIIRHCQFIDGHIEIDEFKHHFFLYPNFVSAKDLEYLFLVSIFAFNSSSSCVKSSIF